jgi:predicted RNase H-like HicB family nuclease
MNRNLETMAKTAASWPYAVRISQDETTDGKTIYVAAHPELVGCIAQGTTVEEATENLKEVTYEYILSLLED